jgi:hypothetical protein
LLFRLRRSCGVPVFLSWHRSTAARGCRVSMLDTNTVKKRICRAQTMTRGSRTQSIPSLRRVVISNIILLVNCFHYHFSLGLLFNPEVGGNMFLRNFGWLSTDYTALYPRRQLHFIITDVITSNPK